MEGRPKIVVADSMEKEVLEKLKQIGDVEFQPGELKHSLKDADVFIVRSATKVTADLISDAPKLKIVARAGVGLDTIDVEACKAKNISVINTPGASTNAVSELAICMMMGIMRKVGFLHYKLKEAKWEKKAGMGNEISGKTLGIIGMGRIGQSVAQKASALGMKIAYHDHHKKDELPYQYFDSVDAMLPNIDVLSLHASTSGGTQIMGKEQFAKMKKGSFFINLARGSLVDENALHDALALGQLAGAALDVYASEPYEGSLLLLDNVLLTPHIGASTHEAQARIGEDLIVGLKNKLGI